MTERAPIRDIGPEFRRRFASDLYRIGREADRFTVADEVQAACDRLRDDEDAAEAEAKRRDAAISNIGEKVAALLVFPTLGFFAACQFM